MKEYTTMLPCYFELFFSRQVDAFISDHESMTAVINRSKYCSTLVLEKIGQSNPYSIAFQKGSKFVPFFTKHITDMKMVGKIDLINDKWLYRFDKCAGSSIEARQFTWRYAFGLALLLISCSIFCSVLLVLEKYMLEIRK